MMDSLGFDIVRSKYEDDVISDFVGLGNLLSDYESYHSAFIIKRQNIIYEFHYTGENISFDILKTDYYHKRTTTIVANEVPAFIAMCKNIQKNANPKYGYFYSGESYDNNGIHQSSIDLGERMTCVGFCLNVLKGFLEQDYLVYTDWSENSHTQLDYLDNYCKKYNLDKLKIQKSHRRITPREYMISGYFNDLPITKEQIDGKKDLVKEHFVKRFD